MPRTSIDCQARRVPRAGDLVTLLVTVYFYSLPKSVPELGLVPSTSVLFLVQPLAIVVLLLFRLLIREYSSSENHLSPLLSAVGWVGVSLSFLVARIHTLTLNQISALLFINLLSQFILCLDLSIMVQNKKTMFAGNLVEKDTLSLLRRGIYFLVFLIVLVPFGFLHGTTSHLTGDEPHYLLMTHSLLHDRDLNLFNNYEKKDYQAFYPGELTSQPADVRGTDFVTSYHSPLLSILLLPGYAFAGRFGAILTMVLMAASLMTFLAEMIDRLFPGQRYGCIVSMMLVWTLPFSQYSCRLFTELPAALAAFLVLRAVLVPSHSQYRTWLLTIICTVCLIMLKMRYLPIAIGLLVLIAVSSPRRPCRAWYPGLVVIAGAVIVSFTLLFTVIDIPFVSRFSHFFRDYHHILTRWDAGSLSAAFGLFFDQEYGLLFHAPVVLMILLAAFLAKSERRQVLTDRQWTGLLFCLALPVFSIIKHKSLTWHGGWAPPLRFLVVCIPLLIPLSTVVRYVKSPTFKAILGLGFLYSIVLSIGMLIRPELAYNYLDGSALWLVLVGQILDRQLVSLFPSFVRPNCVLLLWMIMFVVCIFTIILEHRQSTNAQKAVSIQYRFLDGQVIIRFLILCILGAVVLCILPLFPTLVIEAEDTYRLGEQPGEFFPIEAFAEHQRTPLFRCGRQLATNSSIVFPIRTWTKHNLLRIWAKGTSAGGEWPLIEVRIDDHIVGRSRVVSDQFRAFTHEYKKGAKRHYGQQSVITMRWMAFDFPLLVMPGPQKIRISYINDYYDRETRKDRNLIIDRIELLPRIQLPLLGPIYLSCMPYSLYGNYY